MLHKQRTQGGPPNVTGIGIRTTLPSSHSKSPEVYRLQQATEEGRMLQWTKG